LRRARPTARITAIPQSGWGRQSAERAGRPRPWSCNLYGVGGWQDRGGYPESDAHRPMTAAADRAGRCRAGWPRTRPAGVARPSAAVRDGEGPDVWVGAARPALSSVAGTFRRRRFRCLRGRIFFRRRRLAVCRFRLPLVLGDARRLPGLRPGGISWRAIAGTAKGLCLHLFGLSVEVFRQISRPDGPLRAALRVRYNWPIRVGGTASAATPAAPLLRSKPERCSRAVCEADHRQIFR